MKYLNKKINSVINLPQHSYFLISSFGWILLVSYGAQVTWTAIPRRRSMITAAVVLLLIMGCCRTVLRNRDWTSRESLLRCINRND